MVRTLHAQKSPEEIRKTPQFILKSFENSRRNNETSMWTVMDRSEKLRSNRQRVQETDEQREARSVQLKKKKNDYYASIHRLARLSTL